MNPESVTAHAHQPRAGVLLVNLGTPDAPTPAAIRRYLREFLSDQRVVDLPRALWWPILNGFILPFRPRRLAHSYGSIWYEEGAPLLVHTGELARGVAAWVSMGLCTRPRGRPPRGGAGGVRPCKAWG